MLRLVKRIKGFVFDADGTLFRMDPAYPQEMVRKTLKKTRDGVYNKDKVSYFWFGGNGITRDEILSTEFNVQNIPLFWEKWHEFVSDRDYSLQFKSVYDEVVEVIATLYNQGVPMSIVTDPPETFALPPIDKFLDRKYFKTIITLSDTKGLAPKPDPRGLIVAAERMGKPLNELAYVGDATNDYFGAKATAKKRRKRMHFIYINRGEHPICIRTRNEASSLRELVI